MPALRIALSVAAALACQAAIAAEAVLSGAPPRDLTITKDSAPGWAPSAEMQEAVRNIAETFMSDMDEGRPEYAYILFSEEYKARTSLSDFSFELAKFNTMAGTVTSRRVTKVTWTKDSPKAGPGIYAALDVVSRFANVDRHCGTIVFYQAPGGGIYRITRADFVYVDRSATAEAWTNVSSACPNYTP